MLVSLSAQDWTAIGTGATALILGVTLILVVWQVLEARELRREQFRPWVTAIFHTRGRAIAFVAIRNLGSTVARDVRVHFDPELATTLPGGIGKVAMLEEAIPVLAPGEERLILLDRIPDRMKRDDLPRRHTANLTYRDHRGHRLGPEQYVLDFGLMEGVRFSDETMHDLVIEVRRLRKALTAAE
jgi:hypothetical protein